MSINANNAVLNEILEAVNELPISKDEQEKTIDITENGTTEVTPDEGMALSKVTVNVAVEGGSEDGGYEWKEDTSEVVYEVTCYQNSNVSAYITENGTLTYKRNKMEYINQNPKWVFTNLTQAISQLKSGIKNWINVRQAEVINIPEATGNYLITKLDNSAFVLLFNLKIVKLPDTITALGNSVFQDCNSLKTIELPAAISTMGSSVFRNCSLLKELTIPPLVTQLGSYTFTSCISLETVKGIERMTSIGTNCFDDCPKLCGVIILNEALLELGANIFRNCISLEKIIFKGIPTTVANSAFNNCINIKDIYVPWAEGAIANAPWGATNATIHYNTTYDENGNPVVTEE